MDNSYKTLVCKEQYGSSTQKLEYLQHPHGYLQKVDVSPRHTSIIQAFRSVFLPQGYPDSVSKDYANYQLWDTLQAFASSVSNTLATHSLLQGMGVGDESATVLAATLTWILKNGTGMTGSILFAWCKGNYLDSDAKRWRLFADFLNDFAISLEILAPFTDTYFRWVVCFAGVCKSLVGVAGGATRAALTEHQARRNNMADVSAKDGSQETMVNLAALVFSFALMPLVSGNFPLICMFFVMLTLLHLFANYKAVKSVCMESLNKARLHLIVEQYLLSGKMPDVASVNALEPVFWGYQSHWNIELGVSFSQATLSFDDLRQAYSDLSTNYIVDINRKKRKLLVLLSPEAKTADQLQACVQAELIAFLITHSADAISSELINRINARWTLEDDCSLLRDTFLTIRKIFPSLLADMRAQGWRTDSCLLAADEWRVSWNVHYMGVRKEI